MEKLKVLVELVTDEKIETVLVELKDLATSVDLSISKQAVKTIGACALRLSKSVKKCIAALLDLIKSKVYITYIIIECKYSTRSCSCYN